MSVSARPPVFLSYASQDAATAQRICESLRAAGVEVWFDQNELRGGDAWDQKIKRQIKDCALFLAVVSANTNARAEGYFRLEWKLAVDRSHLIADDTPFLFPVIIDGLSDAAARVPDRFRDVQWTRLGSDEQLADLTVRVVKLLSGETRPGSPRPPELAVSTATPPPPRSRVTRGIGYAAAIGGLLFALGYWLRPNEGSRSKPSESIGTQVAPKQSTAPVAVSRARQLTVQARTLIEELDSTADDFATAESLLKSALELDPNDGLALAVSSLINSLYLSRAFDRSEARRETARSQAERAVKLAPETPNAWLALGRALFGSNSARAEEALQQGLKLDPENGRLLIALGGLYRRQSRFDEALVTYERAAAQPDSRALARYDQFLINFYSRRFAEAERCLLAGLAAAPTTNMVAGQALLEVTWRGRVAEARQVLLQAPAKVRNQPRVVVATVIVCLMAQQPDEALRALERLPADYINDAWFSGPKALLAGLAHKQAGRAEAARLAWEAGLSAAKQRVQREPNSIEEHLRLGELLAWSGQPDLALREAKIVEELLRGRPSDWTFAPTRIHAALGRSDEVVPALQHLLTSSVSGRWPLTPALLRLDPIWERIRADPRFQALCAESETKE